MVKLNSSCPIAGCFVGKIVLLAALLPFAYCDEAAFRLVRRELTEPLSEQTTLSVVTIKLPDYEVTVVDCEPELPEGCRIFFDQWGQGVCLVPTGNNEETAAEAREVIADWGRKYDLDIVAFPREYKGVVAGKELRAENAYVARNPAGHGYAMVLKDAGLLIVDRDGNVQASLLQAGIWAPPSWDPTGEFLAFLQNDPPEREYHFRVKTFSRSLGRFEPVGKQYMVTSVDATLSEHPAVRPVWRSHETSFRIGFSPLGFVRQGTKWQEKILNWPLSPIPNTNLYRASAGGTSRDSLISGVYIYFEDANALLKLPKQPDQIINILLPLTPDDYIGHTVEWIVETQTPRFQSAVFSATWERRFDIPSGHYDLLESSGPYREFKSPEEALAWLDDKIEADLTDDWTAICKVYPIPPALPAREICDRNRSKLGARLSQEFRALMDSTSIRSELWARYDGTALLKAYLQEHPEIRCPAGGTYSAGKGDQLVHCSIHRPGQRHD